MVKVTNGLCLGKDIIDVLSHSSRSICLKIFLIEFVKSFFDLFLEKMIVLPESRNNSLLSQDRDKVCVRNYSHILFEITLNMLLSKCLFELFVDFHFWCQSYLKRCLCCVT